jgi:hypothetical protein
MNVIKVVFSCCPDDGIRQRVLGIFLQTAGDEQNFIFLKPFGTDYFPYPQAAVSRAGLVKDKRLEELICSNTARSLMRMPLRADSEPAALASPSARGVYHAPN